MMGAGIRISANAYLTNISFCYFDFLCSSCVDTVRRRAPVPRGEGEEHGVENIQCSQGDIKNALFFACVPQVS